MKIPQELLNVLNTERRTDSPENQFIQQIKDRYPEANITTIKWNSKVQRFAVDGDKHGQKSGWYVGFSFPVYAGAFGCWRGEEKFTFRADTGHELTEDEKTALRAQYEEEQQRIEEERQEELTKSAKRCQQIWDSLNPAPDNHPYLTKKHIRSYGLKITDGDNRLVIPIMNGNEITSLEYIDNDGNKQFELFGEKSGNWYYIQNAHNAHDKNVIYIVEGYATGASVHEATGNAVLIAFDAGNLIKVAEKLKTGNFVNRFIFIADNDDSGIGQREAKKAANILGAECLIPPRVIGDGKGTDANDYAIKKGLNALKDFLVGKERFLWASEYIADNNAPSWLIKGWVQESAVQMMFGASGAGKTFCILSQALAVATEKIKMWHGYKVVKHGLVLYLNGEGAVGLKSRIRGWLRYHQGIDSTLKASDINMIVARWSENINEPNAIEKLFKQLGQFGEIHPILIIIDTLATHMMGDENRQVDAVSFINAIKEISRRFDNCTVIPIHHTGVSEEAQNRARGSSVLRAAMDIEVKIAEDKERSNLHDRTLGCVMVSHTKDKDIDPPPPLFLDKVRVGTGIYELNENGEPVTEIQTLILLPSDDQTKYETKKEENMKKPTKSEEEAHQMKLALDYCESHNEGTRYDSNNKFLGIDINVWKEKTREIWTSKGVISAGTKDGTTRQKWNRSLAKLLSDGTVAEVNKSLYRLRKSSNGLEIVF